jgi:hypothetical protein
MAIGVAARPLPANRGWLRLTHVKLGEEELHAFQQRLGLGQNFFGDSESQTKLLGNNTFLVLLAPRFSL